MWTIKEVEPGRIRVTCKTAVGEIAFETDSSILIGGGANGKVKLLIEVEADCDGDINL